MEVVESGKTVYGVNTGFGELARVRVGGDQLHQLQENILRSHAAGLGEALPPEVVRWMLLFKICGLIRGHSGVQPQTVDRLVDFYNEGLIPVVPRQGSLGASGDLAPLSHMCLPLMGEGELMVPDGAGAWNTHPGRGSIEGQRLVSDFTGSQGGVGIDQRDSNDVGLARAQPTRNGALVGTGARHRLLEPCGI